MSLGVRAGANGRGLLRPLAMRLTFQAVTSPSHHPTRLGEIGTGFGKSPVYCIR